MIVRGGGAGGREKKENVVNSLVQSENATTLASARNAAGCNFARLSVGSESVRVFIISAT